MGGIYPPLVTFSLISSTVGNQHRCVVQVYIFIVSDLFVNCLNEQYFFQKLLLTSTGMVLVWIVLPGTRVAELAACTLMLYQLSH